MMNRLVVHGVMNRMMMDRFVVNRMMNRMMNRVVILRHSHAGQGKEYDRNQ